MLCWRISIFLPAISWVLKCHLLLFSCLCQVYGWYLGNFHCSSVKGRNIQASSTLAFVQLLPSSRKKVKEYIWITLRFWIFVTPMCSFLLKVQKVNSQWIFKVSKDTFVQKCCSLTNIPYTECLVWKLGRGLGHGCFCWF